MLSKYFPLLFLFLSYNSSIFAQQPAILVPTAAKEYTIVKAEYVGQADFVFWDVPPGLDNVITNNIMYATGRPGVYKCRLTAIKVDWENKTAEQISESFTINILKDITPQPDPTPTPDPTPDPTPTPISKIAKVVLIYEVDTTTAEQFVLLHNIRQKLGSMQPSVPVYFLDDDLPNPFNLVEQGVYLLDSSNKVIKKINLPFTLESLLKVLEESK